MPFHLIDDTLEKNKLVSMDDGRTGEIKEAKQFNSFDEAADYATTHGIKKWRVFQFVTE